MGSIRITVRGHPVHFYVYVETPDTKSKIDQLAVLLRRLPDQHLAVLYPIFIMQRKPGGAMGGGTWRPSEVRGNFTGAGHVRNTGIPAEDVEAIAIGKNLGVIGMSLDRWRRPMGRLEFTLFHEIGHCVDYAFRPGGLVPSGATAADFPGMETNRCGAGSMMVRRAVEAYARYILRPSRIYHTQPGSMSAAEANRRIIETLRQSAAFTSVPAGWEPR